MRHAAEPEQNMEVSKQFASHAHFQQVGSAVSGMVEGYGRLWMAVSRTGDERRRSDGESWFTQDRPGSVQTGTPTASAVAPDMDYTHFGRDVAPTGNGLQPSSQQADSLWEVVIQ